MRDELILALDMYFREGSNAPASSIAELSDFLRAIPIEEHLAESPTFRNQNGVSLKLHNFSAIDPDHPNVGMTRGGRRDKEVWGEFAYDRVRLASTAAAIRANATALTQTQVQLLEDDIADAPEGRVLTRVHRVRERNARVVKAKKARALADDGHLACEGCGFDYAEVYGAQGDGFIECHHIIPVSTLLPGATTKASDLALVCANCHRMIHRRSEWLSMDDLRRTLKPA